MDGFLEFLMGGLWIVGGLALIAAVIGLVKLIEWLGDL